MRAMLNRLAGQTDRPEAGEDYNILQLSGDIIGLVDALGETGQSSQDTIGGRRSPGVVLCCGPTFSVPLFSFRPKLTVNGQLMRDFMAEESPCFALGLVDSKSQLVDDINERSPYS
jgi:hypothetical protein